MRREKKRHNLWHYHNENEYVKLGTYNFEVVKDYTYLGTIPTNKNELRPEIEKRIINANTAYYALLSLINSQSIQSGKNKNP